MEGEKQMNDQVKQFYILVAMFILASLKVIDIVIRLEQGIRGMLCN